MPKLLIVFLCAVMCEIFVVHGYRKEDGRIFEYDSFDEYKHYAAKKYPHFFAEFRGRLAYDENSRYIKDHNALFKEGKRLFRLRPNILADLTNLAYFREFLRLLRSKRFKALDLESDIVGSPNLYTEVPEELDWREKGFTVPIDNQGSCGSCYAFSIAQSIEGQVFKRTGRILGLSPQQIVDCSLASGNKGCVGGSLRNTLTYLEKAGGIMRSADYEYQGKKGDCQFVPELAVVNVTSWAILPAKDEKAIEAAVAHIGPVAVSLNASPKSFQLYSDGIYDDDQCSSDSVNHAMLIVGYGKNFWIAKNWWGKQWGEDGYMRISKGKNLCGIANYAAYSVV